MTKDGRPSRINDIRHFSGSLHTYLEGRNEAVAFGNRIAWFLNGEGFSLGSYPSLYLFFTPSLPERAIHVTDFGGDWWQRYTHVGVARAFPNVADADQIVIDGTVAALLTIRPDQEEVIRKAEHLVRTYGADLRFLLKRRETKTQTVEISFSIAAWPQPSHLHVAIEDKNSGIYAETAPIALRFYAEAFDLAGSVRVGDAATKVAANQSFTAQLTRTAYSDPLSFDLDAFTPTQKPVMSQAVKRRG